MAKYVFFLLLSIAVLAADGTTVSEPEVNFAPFIAAIVIRNQFHCTGSIIDDTSIVTTAKCCLAAQNATDSVFIKVGTTNYRHGGVAYLPYYYRIHPNYTPHMRGHDICVIELTKSIHWTDEIQKINLALTDNFHDLEPGLLYKWGTHEQSTKLKQIRLDFIKRRKCQKCLPHILPKPIIERDMLCVGTNDLKEGTYDVEDGAPFVIGGYLVGIKSWHIDPMHPMVHTDIFCYKDFIN